MNQANTDKVTIVVTGLSWMGHGIRSIESTIEDMLKHASDEIQIAAFMITRGAEDFVLLIKDCLSRGIRVTLILNRFEKQPLEIRNLIVHLAELFPHFTLLEFYPRDEMEDLHAKLIVVDRSKALVGSSNLSWKGLTLNHELAVMIEGPKAAQVSHLIDTLAKDARTRSVKPRP